jgi:hypothetical protein
MAVLCGLRRWGPLREDTRSLKRGQSPGEVGPVSMLAAELISQPQALCGE